MAGSDAGGPLAVFRCDASPRIGAGHVRRCATLAAYLTTQGWRVAFAVGPGTPATVPFVGAIADHLLILSGDEADEASQMRAGFGSAWDLLVVDHHRRDQAFESNCRPAARRIFVIDDLADRAHDADVLLDQTDGREPSAYASFVGGHCAVLTGAQYALLRPAFALARLVSLACRAQPGPVRRILVALGAGDADNATGFVLAALATLDPRIAPGIAIDVVLGAGAPHLAAVRAQASAMTAPTKVHVEVDDMAGLMIGADLAIGAGGISSWERCCLGLPTVLLLTAANQRDNAERLAATGAAVVAGVHGAVSQDAFATVLGDVVADDARRHAISRAAARRCDGRGVYRVGVALLPMHNRFGEALSLRPATMADAGLLLDWQRHPETRRFAFDPSVPTRQGHLRWFTGKLADAGCLFNIIELDGRPAGVVRLDHTIDSSAGSAYVVSIFVAPGDKRRGVGAGGLALARRLVPEMPFIAQVKPENTASRALFAAAGYTHLRDDAFMQLPHL